MNLQKIEAMQEPGTDIDFDRLSMALRSINRVGIQADEVDDVRTIIGCVCAAMDVDVNDVIGPKRIRSVAYARGLCMVLIREFVGLSLPEIAGIFERHHTTVMHACWLNDERCEKRPRYKATYQRMKAEWRSEPSTPAS